VIGMKTEEEIDDLDAVLSGQGDWHSLGDPPPRKIGEPS